MRKFFSFGNGKGQLSLPFTTPVRNDLGVRIEKNDEVTKSQQGYNIREKELKKIHRAAVVGNVAKVQRILLLGKNTINERDKMNRTALHLACANGHPDMVTLLVERKCQLNLYDNEDRTALMKAVQCQEEGCLTILLEHGADPNLTDSYDNTALHYAVVGENISIVEKLLLHHANIEAKNKFGFTPFLLAVNENKEQMVEFLIGKEANVHVVDKSKRTALMLAVTHESSNVASLLLQQGVSISSRDTCGWTAEEYAIISGFDGYCEVIAKHREERRLKNSSQNNNPVVEKHSKEDSVSSISVKPGDDNDSWPTSDDEELDFNIKNSPKPNLRQLMMASQHFKNLETNCGLITLGDKTLLEDDSSDYKGEDRVGALCKTSIKISDFFCPALPSPDSLLQPPPTSLAGLGVTKEGEVQPAIGKKDNGTDIIESAPQEQTVNENLTAADRAHKNNRHVMMSALGLEEEDGESPWDSENISESLSETSIDHFSGTTDQKGPGLLNEQVEDVFYIPSCMSGSRNFKMAKLEERSVDIPAAHTDSLEKYPYLTPTIEVKDSVSNKSVEMKENQTSKSDLSDWKSTGLNYNSGTCQIARHLKVDDKCPSVSQSMTKTQSASTEFKQTILIDKKKINDIGALIMLENYKLHDVGESQLPENREHKEDLPAELALEMTTEEEGKRFDESENKHLEELREEEREKQTSEESVITQGFEKAYSLTSHPLQVKDDSTLSEMHQDEGRPAKKTSNEKEEVKKQIDSVDDLGDSVPPSEITSGDSQSHCSNYMICISLIEQHGMNCKDSISLLKIQNAILSYERLIELKKNHCGQLERKNKKLENKVNGLQKQLSETKEMASQLELQKVRWEQELSSLRFALNQEKEKRRTAKILYEKIQEELKQKKEQYNKEVEMKRQLEHNLRTLDVELRTVRNDFSKVVEEQKDTKKQLSQEQDARILQDGIPNNHLCKQKEIEMDNKKMSSGISSSHENHMWQDQVAMLRLEIETINNQNQEKERKYCEDIEIVKEKNVSLQKAIKLKEETLTKTIFQYSEQINALTDENTMLKSKLETEKQNKERLDARVESYQARLAAAIQDHDQSQASKRDLELAFQRAKDEWFRVQDKLNFEVSSLKDNNELLSQNLSKAESKFNTLEVELHHTRDALREKTLVLECVQRDLGQTQCQKKEIELMYQNEQDKVSKYIGKQESLKERLSQLQSENMLLQQQLDDAHNKASSKEKIVINIQDQFQDIIKKIQTESEKQSIVMEERNKELINECNLLRERMYEYEKEKTEREVAVRQLQGELADALKKQSMSEASLEITSRFRMNLEDEAQVLKKKLAQLRSQLQHSQEQHAEAVTCVEKLKDHVQKLEVENAKLKDTVKKQTGKIEQLQENVLSTSSGQIKKLSDLKQSLECSLDQEMKKNDELEKEVTRLKELLKVTRGKLSEYENEELCFHGDLKTSRSETNIQINMLKHKVDDLTAKLETMSSRNQTLTQELSSMKEIQMKCEKLEKHKKKLEQQVVNLKSCMEANIEFSKIEQYKRDLEERARVDIEKSKQANLFLQMQVASQECLLGQLRENNASLGSQMELRIKDLEFELFKMRSSQEGFNKIEVENYRQRYLAEVELRMSLASELNRTNEKLTETRTKLLMEKQQKQTLLDAINMSPSLHLPYGRNVDSSSLFKRTAAPRENIAIPTTSSWPPNNGIETFLTKMQQELEKNITRELEEAAAEFESNSFSVATFLESPYGSHPNYDEVLKSSKDFIQCLKKNYKL